MQDASDNSRARKINANCTAYVSGVGFTGNRVIKIFETNRDNL